MPVASEPFIDSSCDSFRDIFEVAGSEVQPQLLKAAGNLDPRMVPGIGYIIAVLVSRVLNDVLRVLQRERQIRGPELEETAEAAWRRRQGARRMSGISREANVPDHIHPGNDGKPGVQNHGRPEDALKVSLSAVSMVITHLYKVASHVACLTVGLQGLHRLRIIQKRIMAVPGLEDPSPGSPTRDAEVRREEIGIGTVRRLLIDIEACYHPHPWIALIAVEHLLAERNEGRREDVVVFSYHNFVGHGEGPLLRHIA